MIACGWTRVPLTRVALASLLTSALYLPLMLYLVVVFGDAMDDRAGLWTWPFLLGLIVALAFMRYRVFTFHENGKAARRCVPELPWRRQPAAPAAASARPDDAVAGVHEDCARSRGPNAARLDSGRGWTRSRRLPKLTCA